MLRHIVIIFACAQHLAKLSPPKPSAVTAGLGERSSRTERLELRERGAHCPLSASSLPLCRCEQPARPLIKPADLLLLIDFLIINSVCPSISLRRRISPDRAQVLLRCYLPASGYPASQQISTTLIKSVTASAGFLGLVVSGFSLLVMHVMQGVETGGLGVVGAPASTPTCA